jgi:hypothetical protein
MVGQFVLSYFWRTLFGPSVWEEEAKRSYGLALHSTFHKEARLA